MRSVPGTKMTSEVLEDSPVGDHEARQIAICE
jgi:hypothetical protein